MRCEQTFAPDCISSRASSILPPMRNLVARVDQKQRILLHVGGGRVSRHCDAIVELLDSSRAGPAAVWTGEGLVVAGDVWREHASEIGYACHCAGVEELEPTRGDVESFCVV